MLPASHTCMMNETVKMCLWKCDDSSVSIRHTSPRHLCICYIFWYCFFFSFKSFEKVRIYAQKAIKRKKLAEAIRRQREWLERFIIRKSRKYCKYPRRLCSGGRQLCCSLSHYIKGELCFPLYCASPTTL